MERGNPRGRTCKTIIKGTAIMQRFIPSWAELLQQSHIPTDQRANPYRLEGTYQAIVDSTPEATVKPVIVYSRERRKTPWAGRRQPAP